MASWLAAFTFTVLTTQAPPVNPQAAALADFSQRVQEYLRMRESIGRQLTPLSPTASAGDLRARQQALAAALRQARAGRRHGDLVPAPVQDQIRRTVAADYRGREVAARRAALEEVPAGALPRINGSYPHSAPLPTVPPLLLASLPRLPDNLQYRFYGRHVVILDGDVEIVLDYVQDAIPR